jgi:hypothetical protein
VIPRAAPLAVAALAAGGLLGGCGGADPARPAADSQAIRVPTLPARAVPYLESKERALTPTVLAREAGLDTLAGLLAEWGYAGGASRSFQGQSKRLQVVESRTLRFRTAGGAGKFMRIVRGRPGSFLPGAERPRAYRSRGRRGVLIKAAPCTCHMASPAYLGVVASGPTISWLEINGPRATVRALTRLAAQAP